MLCDPVAGSPSIALCATTCLLLAAVFTCGVPSAVLAAASGEARQNDGSEIPHLSEFYGLPNGLRVQFEQRGETLSAKWLLADGTSYGRGSYRWDAATKSFKGTATNRHVCREGDGREGANVSVLIREELSLVSDTELRDLWTKPLSVDCTLGVLEKFKWTETLWRVVKKDDTPFSHPADGREKDAPEEE